MPSAPGWLPKRSLAIAVLLCAGISPAQSAEPGWWTQRKRECGLPPNLAYNTWVNQGSPCPAASRTAPGAPPASDNAAERQRQETEAERRRQAETARRIKEEADRQAAFERDRDEAARELRGSSSSGPELLQGITTPGDGGLRDAVGSGANAPPRLPSVSCRRVKPARCLTLVGERVNGDNRYLSFRNRCQVDQYAHVCVRYPGRYSIPSNEIPAGGSAEVSFDDRADIARRVQKCTWVEGRGIPCP